MTQSAQFMQSPALEKPARLMAEYSMQIMGAAFWRAVLLIVVFFMMLTGYKFLTRRWVREPVSRA